MHVTLRQMRIFEAVASYGSMSRAATALNLTQPAISMQMKQLEEQIGVPLIEQIGKRLFLTEAGTEMRAHAQRFITQTLSLKASMEQFRGLHRGLLRIAVVSTANYFLPPLIAALSEQHPGVRVNLQVANRESVLAALADNRTDLAITGRPPDGDELVSQHFMDNPLVVIAPPSHPLVGTGSIPLQRMGEEQLVLREAGSGTRAAVERQFMEHGVDYLPGCELNTNEAIKLAVQAGLGLGVVSAQTIELECQAGRLVVLPVEGFPIMRRWYLVYRRGKRLSAVATAFCDLLLGQARQSDAAAPEAARAATRAKTRTARVTVRQK
jgi:DNA-binding transcriptional LysR family regulator